MCETIKTSQWTRNSSGVRKSLETPFYKTITLDDSVPVILNKVKLTNYITDLKHKELGTVEAKLNTLFD